jgi:hypothetical protein
LSASHVVVVVVVVVGLFGVMDVDDDEDDNDDCTADEDVAVAAVRTDPVGNPVTSVSPAGLITAVRLVDRVVGGRDDDDSVLTVDWTTAVESSCEATTKAVVVVI